jgi:deoxyribodipyrimidine photo-lyase
MSFEYIAFMEEKIVVFWFRRDLRISDNTGLYHALKSGYRVLPVFILDTNILSRLEMDDPRISFICECINNLNSELTVKGSSVVTFNSTPEEAFLSLCDKYNIKAVYVNRDYEPYSLVRDEKIKTLLQSKGINFFTYKDQVIYEKSEIAKADGKPYTVYTPYSAKWLQSFSINNIAETDSLSLSGNFIIVKENKSIKPEAIGFRTSDKKVTPFDISVSLVADYHLTRDVPSIQGTSLLGPHLRFGTISIREVFRETRAINEVFIRELIWREFFMQILFHFPAVTEKSFKPKYDRIEWVNNEDLFDRWCKGITGFPIVDAGMRELEQTGYMHNRVRMITANFLTRYLLIDWRWGEAWFASKLLDFELASNNGNWQWAAGTGCDAAPYFRIFNPDNQQKKFDPQFKYIKKWIPEYGTPAYPKPIVNASEVRERAIMLYQSGINT